MYRSAGKQLSRRRAATRTKRFRCRLHVPRLRVRALCFIRLLEKMRSLYDRLLTSIASAGRDAIKRLSMKKSSCAISSSAPASASAGPSYARSNSFYAEAIADCLDFIKRSSSAAMDSRQ
eukprot:Gb_26604 [translate_table: standard]